MVPSFIPAEYLLAVPVIGAPQVLVARQARRGYLLQDGPQLLPVHRDHLAAALDRADGEGLLPDPDLVVREVARFLCAPRGGFSRGLPAAPAAAGTPPPKASCRTGEIRDRSCLRSGDTDRAYMRDVRTISPATMNAGVSRNIRDPGGSGSGPPSGCGRFPCPSSRRRTG